MKNCTYQIYSREYKGKNWIDFQKSIIEIVKSFPEEYKLGEIDEINKSVMLTVTKVPFYDGISICIKCEDANSNILVNFFIDDADIPEIMKTEAKNLVIEAAGNIYSSFSGTLHLSAKEGPLKEKREEQLNTGGGIVSFIILIASIIVVFYSMKTCSSI
ncbi:hypothetical protein [Soonwooa purpurea]